jgi:trans-aconitate methyltransferase
MRPDVIQTLLDLNQEFYQTFAIHFSETRERVQPGVLRAISGIPDDSSILDLGCGNGRLSSVLADQGHHGQYLGLDSSQELLALAEAESNHGGKNC